MNERDLTISSLHNDLILRERPGDDLQRAAMQHMTSTQLAQEFGAQTLGFVALAT